MCTNPLMIQNGYDTINNPYFQAAFQSYNSNYAQAAATQQAQLAAANTNNVSTQANAQSQVSFEGKQTKKKKSGAGWAIGGLIFTAGAAALCFAAHRKGVGDTAVKKVLNGLGQYWESASSGIGNCWNRVQGAVSSFISSKP